MQKLKNLYFQIQKRKKRRNSQKVKRSKIVSDAFKIGGSIVDTYQNKWWVL